MGFRSAPFFILDKQMYNNNDIRIHISFRDASRERGGQRFFSHAIADIPFRHSLLSERKCINFHRWTLTYAREIHYSRLWRGAFWLWLMAPHLPSARVSYTRARSLYTILHAHALLSFANALLFCPRRFFFWAFTTLSRTLIVSRGRDNFTITIRRRKKCRRDAARRRLVSDLSQARYILYYYSRDSGFSGAFDAVVKFCSASWFILNFWNNYVC